MKLGGNPGCYCESGFYGNSCSERGGGLDGFNTSLLVPSLAFVFGTIVGGGFGYYVFRSKYMKKKLLLPSS